MQELISDISQKRLVTVKGIPGIGKTTMAKAVIQYLDERQSFSHGILLLSLRGLDQAPMLLTRLHLLIKDKQGTDGGEDKIIEFFKDKEVLLVLDNAEDSLKKDGINFREII